MKAFNKLSKLILLAAVLAGCSKGDDGALNSKPLSSDNYVAYYIKPVELFGTYKYDFTTGTGAPALPEQEYNRFRIEMRFSPTSYETYNGVAYTGDEVVAYELEHVIRPTTPVVYDSLCSAHKDTEFGKTPYPYEQFSYPATFRRMTLDIVSDAMYDAAHPAGASLADIISVRFPSAKEYVESGYKLVGPSKNQYYADGALILVKPLTQFNTEYRKLVGGWFRFEFTKAPDATSTHRFTLVYRDEDGRELTTAMPPVTIKVAQ